MKLTDYQLLSAETAIYPKKQTLDYLSLGLCSEVGELLEVYDDSINMPYAEYSDKAFAELGDCLWYLAQLYTAVDLNLADHLAAADAAVQARANKTEHAILYNIAIPAARVAGVVKKSIRDSGGKLTETSRLKLREHFKEFLVEFLDWVYLHNFDIHQIAAQNYARLKSRQERGVLQGSGDTR